MKNSTLRISLIGLFTITAFAAHSQNVGINTAGTAANSSAILDLNTGNTYTSPHGKGLLIPNVALSSATDATTIASPATSLMVYVPSASGLTPAGYYYNSGTPASPTWTLFTSTMTGAGTLNYLARWTPNGNTLGIGITQDNGTEVGIQTSAYSFTAGNPLLQVTANSSNINALAGVTSQTGGAGVTGGTTTTGINGYGVKGLNAASVGGGSQYAVYGSSTATAGNSYGLYGASTGTNTGTGINYGGYHTASGSPTANYGTYSSASGASTLNYAGYFTATGGTSNYSIIVPSGGGFVGFGTLTPARELEIGGTTNTERIDGLKSGNTFNVAPAATTSYMMYANTNGDVYAMPAGTTNYVLTWTATGPTWSPAATTTISANNGAYMSTATNVQFGTNPLIQNTTLPLGNYTLTETATIAGIAHTVSNATANGYALEGENSAASGSSSGIGVYGTTAQSSGYGLEGTNTNLFGGTGIYGTAATYGVEGLSSGSVGVYGVGSTGVEGNGTAYGLYGIAPVAVYGDANNSTNSAGGYFTNNTGSVYTYLAYYTGATYYGLYTNSNYTALGTKSTIVPDKNGDMRSMYCAEAPEVLFEDYGTSKLENGKVHIDLDPTYAANVAINEKHQLRVMITLNDECPNAVYVTNRTATGFDVIEMNHGTSDAAFTYEVVANRADKKVKPGEDKANYSDYRFEHFDVPPPPAKPVVKNNSK